MFHVPRGTSDLSTKVLRLVLGCGRLRWKDFVLAKTQILAQLEIVGGKMARTICIANQKGGVGKTTTSVNLSAALATLGRKVLLIDLDPQGNASSGLGLKRHEYQDANIYHVLIGEKDFSQIIQPTKTQGLFVAPANSDLVGAEIELVDFPQREFRLRKAIATIANQYHYILIDCPPSLGLLTLNALTGADSFLVPLQCEYYALEGLSQLLNTAGLIKKNLNPALHIEGIVLTMFNSNTNLSHQVVNEIRTHFADKVFNTIVPRNVRLSESPSYGQTIFEYDAKSVGAAKYTELSRELDQRVYGRQNLATPAPAPRREGEMNV